MSDPLDDRDETELEESGALAPGRGDPAGAESAEGEAARATFLQDLQEMVESLATLDRPLTPADAVREARDAALEGQDDARLAVGHVAHVAHCYPGDELRFHTRITPLEEIDGYTLRITLPAEVEFVQSSGPPSTSIPHVETGGIAGIPTRYLRWTVDGPFAMGQRCDHVMTVRVPSHSRAPMGDMRNLDSPSITSTAEAIPHASRGRSASNGSEDGASDPNTEGDSEAPVHGDGTDESVQSVPYSVARVGAQRPAGSARETMVVEVRPKAAYLHFLPALYERDPLMSRFLMLFESFWAPIQMQVGGISDYFDPKLMPLEVLHWMAAHLDLEVDGAWPVQTQRRMLASAVALYRKRGTRYGLQRLLEIYTGGTVYISEHRANNFRLGPGAKLGHGVALGARNQPFTFSVRIIAPPIEGNPAPEEAARLRQMRDRRIRRLIDAEKPAHVTYTLDIQEASAGESSGQPITEGSA